MNQHSCHVSCTALIQPEVFVNLYYTSAHLGKQFLEGLYFFIRFVFTLFLVYYFLFPFGCFLLRFFIALDAALGIHKSLFPRVERMTRAADLYHNVLHG